MELEDIDFKVDYFILATHHRNDDKITFDALKKGIPYVGVVASAKKTGIIKSYLVENGILAEELDNFLLEVLESGSRYHIYFTGNYF